MSIDIISTLADDFKFSEEIIVLSEDYNDSKDKPSNFEITFNSGHSCKTTKDVPAVSNSNICRNCYYRKFAHKISEVRKSKRKNFLDYQLSTRENKQAFLAELNEFITDNESYFDNIDYTIAYDYKELINDVQDELNKLVDKDSIIENLTQSKMGISPSKQELDIFISHSSSDKGIAKRLIELLIISLRLDPNKIRCTSVDGYKLEGGINTDERLKKEIFGSKVLIGIISDESLNSHYVLFELGARWGTELPFKPLVTSKIVYDSLRKPLENLNVQNISNPSDVFQLIEEISNVLDTKLMSPKIYQNKVQELCSQIEKESIQNETEPIAIPKTDIELTETALLLLTEISNDESGTLLIVESLDGYSIETKMKSFDDKNNRRVRAKLESALKQLYKNDLISEIGTSGNSFGISEKGYEYIDNL